MIYNIVHVSSEQFTFQNSRLPDLFVAWLEDSSGEWIVTRHPSTIGHSAEIWGRVREADGVWFAKAGNMPHVEFLRMSDRDGALAWVTDERSV